MKLKLQLKECELDIKKKKRGGANRKQRKGKKLSSGRNSEHRNRLPGDTEEQIGQTSVWIALEQGLGYLTLSGSLLCFFIFIFYRLGLLFLKDPYPL